MSISNLSGVEQPFINNQSESIREKGISQSRKWLSGGHRFGGYWGATWPMLGGILDLAGFSEGGLKILVLLTCHKNDKKG